MKYSDLTDSELVKKINDCYKLARDHSKTWRKENRTLHEHRAGHQWSEEDTAVLEEQGRPVVVFNRSGTVIDAVVGNEVSNRQEIRFLPRSADDPIKTEMATNTVRWVRQECNAEDEESDAFESVLIGGMGWIETRVDYDDSGEPIIRMDSIDPNEMYWDPMSRKHNLEDRKWQIREKWIPRDEIDETWPDTSEVVPGENLAPDLEEDIRNADPPYYERESTGYDKKEKTVRVLEFECIESVTMYVVKNPLSGKIESLEKKTFDKFIKKLPDTQYSRTKRPKCYRAFVVGNTLLERGENPRKNWFNYECITGKRDAKSNTFYGLMRGMKDPQEWANKFFSQILHIINSNSKGGFFWEDGALVNEQNAKEDLARPDGMVKLKAGGLQKIKERQMFQFPSSIDRMLEFAISSIRDVPGVNLELLGMANREQAGVLESQRSRQALTVLAPIFSNLRRYRKNQGKMLLYYIREFIPEGRLIRVLGEEGAMVVPMMKDPLMAEYDVIVEQSPTSPNMKTEAWVALRDVLPVLQAAGMQPPKEIVDILPLPEAMTAKWKESIKNGPPPEVQQKMQEMEQMIQKLQQENQQLQMGAQTEMMKIQANQQVKAAELQQKQQLSEAELNLKIQEIQANSQLKMAELQAEIDLKREQISAEIQLKQAETEANITLQKQKLDSDAEFKRSDLENKIALGNRANEHKMMMDENRIIVDIKNREEEVSKENAEEISELRKDVAEGMKGIADSVVESIKIMATSIEKGIAESANKPKVLVFDKDGNPIGSKPVDTLQKK